MVNGLSATELVGYIFKSFNFNSPKLIFGIGSISILKNILDSVKCRKYLLVTDPNIEKAGIITTVSKLLEGYKGEAYLIEPREPYIEDSEKIAGYVRGKDYDVVIGLGGGSVLDLAKVASFAPYNPGKVADYIGIDKVKSKGLYLILIPTTAGTGSEVSKYIVLSTVDGVKVAIGSDYIVADYAVVDPMLTLTMPTYVTISGGLDALAHAFEALISKKANLLTDLLSLEAIKLIFKYLPIATYNGDDIEARYYMSLASTLAGLAFSNSSLVAGHAIAYTYAHRCRLPHGISVGIALPYMLKYNAPASLNKLLQVARVLGIAREDKSDYEIALDLVLRIRNLLKLLKVPTTLKELNIPKEELPALAKSLVTQYARLLPNNPRRIEYEDALSIFSEMWEGST